MNNGRQFGFFRIAKKVGMLKAVVLEISNAAEVRQAFLAPTPPHKSIAAESAGIWESL